MLATLALIFAPAPLPTSGGGGELSFPTGPAQPGTISVRVLDRNHLPLRNARVQGVFEGAGVAQRIGFGDARACVEDLGESVTGEGGRAILSAPTGGWCGLTVTRSGFAPGSFLPLFEGHAYDLVLDFGASITVICQDENERAVEAELVIEHQSFPRLPVGAAPIRRMNTGLDGMAEVDFLPVGPTWIQARAADGSRGRLEVSIGSAWRHNALFGRSAFVIDLHPTVERLLAVTDAQGNPIEGLRAALTEDAPEGWTTARVEPGGVRVRGILDGSFDEHGLQNLALTVFARGWRALNLSVSRDGPSSAWTEPVKLRRDLRVSPAPRSGRMWTPADPLGHAPWFFSSIESGEERQLDVVDGFALVGAVSHAGRVVSWLTAEEQEDRVALEWFDASTIRARMSVDGEPYHNGLVRFELAHPALGRALPAGLSGRSFTFADPDGVVELGGLFPGQWRVAFSTSLIHTEGSEATVEVGFGENREVVLEATRGVDLAGRVIDESSSPVSGGRVSVIGTGRHTVSDGVFPVQEDGSFLVTGLRPGGGYVLAWTDDPDPRGWLPMRYQERLLIAGGRHARAVVGSELPDSITIVVEAE